MGTSYNPKIVTDGLVLHLDAANRKSYPGAGTSWVDLSKNKYNGVLSGGYSYSGGIAQGSLFFDSVNGTCMIPIVPVITSTCTIAAWVNHTLKNNVQRYVTVGNEIAVIRHDGFTSSGQLHFYVKTGGSLKMLRVNSQVVGNTWSYFAGTWDGTNQSVYKNGVRVGSQVPTAGSLNAVDASGYITSPVEQLNGFLPIAQVYNKALTATEILQNYNATKGRFGL
jgi:hypothetical protein